MTRGVSKTGPIDTRSVRIGRDLDDVGNALQSDTLCSCVRRRLEGNAHYPPQDATIGAPSIEHSIQTRGKAPSALSHHKNVRALSLAIHRERYTNDMIARSTARSR